MILTKAEYAVAMRAIADRVDELLKAHDAAEHPGSTCTDERYNVIAFLGHAIGVKPLNFQPTLLAEKMAHYAATCPDCAHHRN